jgi:hypothetical protein
MLQWRPLAYVHGYGRPPVAANLSPKSLLIVNQLRFDRILYHSDLMPNSDSMAAEATSAKRIAIAYGGLYRSDLFRYLLKLNRGSTKPT